MARGRDRGKFFWKNVRAMLDDGKSITDIADANLVSFDMIWEHFRSSLNMRNRNKLLIDYLNRETDFNAHARLRRFWDKILADYNKSSKETPVSLARIWGVKPSVIEDALRASRNLRDSINDVLGGMTVDVIIDNLLSKED